MTREQQRVADYAAEYAADVSEHIVDAVVHSVGDTITESEARDLLDSEQGLVEAHRPRRRLAFVSRPRRPQPSPRRRNEEAAEEAQASETLRTVRANLPRQAVRVCSC